MFTRLMLGALLFVLIGCDAASQNAATTQPTRPSFTGLPSETTPPPPALVASELPVVLLKSDSDSGNPQATRDQVNLAAWHDGRIVWRTPEGQLLAGRFDPAKLEELLARLHEEGVFGTGKTEFGNLGPDSSFDVIEVRLHDRELQMRSWHELYGDGVEVLVTANGVEWLEGRDAAAVMAEQ